MKTNNELMDFACRTDVVTDEYITSLQECSQYNSMGTMNWVISALKVICDRIESNQFIRYNDKKLNMNDFQDLIEKNFSVYIVRGLFVPKNHWNKKTYFKLENTSEGMDLVYTGEQENDLFKPIADLNDKETLVRVIPTNVVYIKNRKTGEITPFLTEHNSCYVYDEKDGKIKEFFENKS